MKKHLKKLSAVLVVLALSFSVATPSFALGIGDGDGNGGGGGGGSNNGGGTGTTQPPADGGGGGGGYSDITVIRQVPDSAGGSFACAVRSDGKASIGADYKYQTEYGETYGGPQDLPPGGGWYLVYSTPSGKYVFERQTFMEKTCLYPSLTYTTTVQCVIRSDASISMVVPNSAVLARGSGYSSYTQGSYDYNACLNSHSKINLDLPITQDGFFEANAITYSQNATVEIAITKNDVTGQMDAPKIIGLSAMYAGVPKQATASLDCMNGALSPGKRLANYSSTMCSSQQVKNPAYVCTASIPLFAGLSGPSWQGMRDNVRQPLTFNQNVSGAGITVNKYQTQYLRDKTSMPWLDTNYANDNIFHLNKNATDSDSQSILTGKDGQQSDWMNGKFNTVWASAQDASDSNAPTTVTQVLKWSGTRTQKSFKITGLNPLTGAFEFTPITVKVPTDGTCSSTGHISYVKALGANY